MDQETTKASRQQQLRSVVTRERLIAAALDEIHAVGYHAATTQDIAARAAVSRGALLHHFPARADLILAAMQELLEDGIRQIRDVARGVQSGATTLDGFVDFVFQLFSGRFFHLSLEMITEARNDAALRAPMIPIVSRFHRELDTLWADLAGAACQTPQQAQVILNLTLCLMRGMGVQAVLRPDPAYFQELVTTWKTLLPMIIASQSAAITPDPPQSSPHPPASPDYRPPC